MYRGYVKLWRKIQDSAVFRSKTPDLIKVWVWCLTSATHRPIRVSVRTGRGFQEVDLEPGQFIFGRHSAAKQLGLSPEVVRKRMAKLEKLRKTTTQTTSHYTIITLCNWATYASPDIESDQPNDHQTTTQRPPNDHKQEQEEQEEGRKKTARALRFDEIDMQLARHILAGCLTVVPTMKPPNLETWANDIRLIREQDGRESEEIRSLFDWANQDDFWRANILSPRKLRKQWDQLQAQQARGMKHGRQDQRSSGRIH